MKNLLLFALFGVLTVNLNAQNSSTYWQQAIDYKMEIDVDVNTYQYIGKQTIQYTNNSPDTLDKIYIHLFWNAFQPGSMMDNRLQTIEDPDKRMTNKDKQSRIKDLQPSEIGYQKIDLFTQNGKKVSYEIQGTVMEVQLAEAISPNSTTKFYMEWNAQVPLQIRRSGRQSKEGIELSMTQWYPKVAEYDFEGWHADEYIAREFQGVWGDFDVKINIDKDYIIGGSGVLQNPNEIGHGYSASKGKAKKGKLNYHFVANNVHDFAWGADPDYIQKTVQVPNGPLVRFFYQKDKEYSSRWEELIPYTAAFFPYMDKRYGKYPYPEYSVIQGGDGGMEYAMCTLITGDRVLKSLVGVTYHEIAHSWFQHILATNETQHPWMDEGFTSYSSHEAMTELFEKDDTANAHSSAYNGYKYLVKSGKQEPLTTLADHYHTNLAYGVGSYSMGEIFLNQLGYIVGEDKLREIMLNYFDQWKFKHPSPNDFKRVAEKTTGLNLKWYLNYWVNTTNTIDYAISASAKDGDTEVILENKSDFAMPIEVMAIFKDGSTRLYYIPLASMRGVKEKEYSNMDREVLPDWGWTIPKYNFTIKTPLSKIEKLIIDPSVRMADINIENNTFSPN